MRACWHPHGPIGGAELTILFDATAIMLAVVIPVILLTLGVCLVVPGGQHRRALSAGLGIFGPDRDDRLVDPGARDPVSGRHRLDRRRTISIRRADRSRHGPARRRSRLARLEVAVHLPRPGHRERQSAGRPGRARRPLPPDLDERHELLLRAAARQPDLHDAGHDHPAQSAGRPARRPTRVSRRSSAAMASPTCASTVAPIRRTSFEDWVETAQDAGRVARRGELTRNWRGPARPWRPPTYAPVARACSIAISGGRVHTPADPRRNEEH